MQRGRGRAVALLAFGGLLAAGAAGCNAETLTKRELVVFFSSTATEAQHRGALAACTGAAPNTSPEPIPTVTGGPSGSRHLGEVRFRIDHADDHDVAMLTRCLNKQPGVIGVNVPDAMG